MRRADLARAAAYAGALALACATGAAPASAEEVRVAVAANFRATCEALARRFEARGGPRVLISVGSTGSLCAQIRNGAPFDLFLAADAERPAALEAEGLTLERWTYARGRLVLTGHDPRAPQTPEASLRAGAFQHLALANPDAAPYGAAARLTLQRLGLWEALLPRLVYGESVTQTYQFVRSGSAELGFVSRAQVDPARERFWLVPEELHAPLRQDAVLLKGAPGARALWAYLQSPPAQALIEAAGYGRDPQHDLAAPAPAPLGSPLPALRLTLLLAATSTLVLLVCGTPLAWWLARGQSRWRVPVEALVALPLVLPPTVLGFYLLVLLGPAGPLGATWEGLGGPRLVFSFSGLVIGSVVYSLPFVVQPLRTSFQAIDPSLLEAAATLRASALDRWRSVILPLARHGFLTAAVLGFAHTVGEFGVVLMIGGSIPGQTKVLSIAIFDHVEQLEYARAHLLAGGMLAFSFATLLLVYALNRRLERVGP